MCGDCGPGECTFPFFFFFQNPGHTQWHNQPKNLGGAKKIWGAKMLDFRRITLFCLEKRFSKHKITFFSKNWGGHGPFPPGYAYGHTPISIILVTKLTGICFIQFYRRSAITLIVAISDESFLFCENE